MTGQEALRLASRAKINLHLKVLFPRPDGYHELRTVFQTIDLADRLELSPAADGELTLACDQPGVPTDERNLCLRAARSLQQQAGRLRGARIRLEKRIPVQAGLGGGSSNAAATLWGLNALWGLGLSLETLADLGGRLGADVPFFFLGGTVFGLGRGDELVSLPDLPAVPVVLVCPPVAISTAWAYGQLNFSLTKTTTDNKIRPLRRALIDGRYFLDHGENDFEAVAFPEHPLLLQIRDSLLESGATRAMMSGSGSVVFGIFDSEAAVGAACRQLDRQAGFGRVIPARFVSGPAHRADFPVPAG